MLKTLLAGAVLPIVVVVLSSFVNGALLGVSADVWTGDTSALQASSE